MAQVINGHWTNRSAKAFVYRIAFDFITQIEKIMASEPVTASELAKRLNVSKGRVSQILNDPRNLTLQTIVEWAQALGVKVAVVAYDDGDVDNDDGPINPQIFTTCWEKSGKPTDFFTAGISAAAGTSAIGLDDRSYQWQGRIEADAVTMNVNDIHPAVWQTPLDKEERNHA